MVFVQKHSHGSLVVTQLLEVAEVGFGWLKREVGGNKRISNGWRGVANEMNATS